MGPNGFPAYAVWTFLLENRLIYVTPEDPDLEISTFLSSHMTLDESINCHAMGLELLFEMLAQRQLRFI
jgi:hypothetical protein